MLKAKNSNKLIFAIEGISIEVLSDSVDFCLTQLTLDFQYFLDTPSQKHVLPSELSIQLKIIPQSASPELLPDAAAKEVHSDYVVYQNPKKNKRWIDYHGEALLCVTDKKGSTSATLWCSNEHLAHELSYLYLLSKIGFFLDSKGLHRVHALGIHQHHLGALILIPSGGGKSSLALELLEKNNLTLLSDDSPLVDRKGNLHPFPMRIAFRHNTKLPVNLEKNAGYMERRKYGGKKLVSMAQLPHPPTRTNTTIKPKLLVIAERHGSKKYPKFRSLSKLQALQYLLRDMVVGLGLPQLAELILTKGLWTLPLLVPTAASRALAAARLIAKSDCVVLELSTDKKENAALLYKKLSSYNLVDKQKNNIIIK